MAGSRRRSRIFIYLALIIVLGLGIVYVLLNNPLAPKGGEGGENGPVVEATAAAPVDLVDIVITTQAIPRGAVFVPEVLATIKYPRSEMLPDTFYETVEDVVGKRAKADIDAQVPVTRSLVVDQVAEGSMVAFKIPKGMVGVTIPIPDRISANSFAPKAGDHINLIATVSFLDLDPNFQAQLPNFLELVYGPAPQTEDRGPGLTADVQVPGGPPVQGRAELDPTLGQPLYVYPGEAQRPRLVSQTLLQDVIVLQVGDFSILEDKGVGGLAMPTPTPMPEEDTSQIQQAAPVQPDTITLLVSPQDSVTLNYLIYAGAKLTLVLRGAGDDQRTQTEAVTLQYLMDQYNIPVPAKQPYGLNPRIDTLAVPPQYNITVATPQP